MAVTAAAPVLVASTADSYLFFPQTLEHGPGPGTLLLHVQASSDDLHDDGWAGRHFSSSGGGWNKWREVPNAFGTIGQHIRACVPLPPGWDAEGYDDAVLCLPCVRRTLRCVWTFRAHS